MLWRPPNTTRTDHTLPLHDALPILDEGNIYECLIEAYKHDIRNCWWIVDYNRQSLDATTAERMFRRFDEIFATCGWRVVTLKYGKQLEAAFKEKDRESTRLNSSH